MIDDRDRRQSDFEESTSITVIGTAEDTGSKIRKKYAALLVNRYPELTDFVNSPDCAVIRVKVDKIYITSEFESVLKIER
jgi:hypothetical protein